MERVFIGDLVDHVGGTATIQGWVSVRRDQGKMVFFDFRDMTGGVQGVVLPSSPAMETAKNLRVEFAVAVSGEVNKRPDKNVQSDKQNGDIELKITNIEVLSASETPPFDLSGDTSQIGEETRLQYRYLDLRTSRMQRNIKLRSEFVRRCREFLFKNRFTEIETPLLTESTPEGSRDFVVPSRLHPGEFYALPQSPQQYKQLLMVGGFERYFQIARAVRDEDLRADRGFEHSQIDIEMSFAGQEDVMTLVEEMMTKTVETLGFTIKEKPFPRFTYQEAMEKFGADKFDLRTEEEKARGVLAYAWVYKFPFFEKTENGGWTFTHNPFSMPIPEYVDSLLSGQDIGNILTTQYDLVCNGFETGGGSIRAHRPELLEATYKIMGYTPEETEERVGHMIDAFKFGAPPHGGIALGIERNLMNLTGESYLREVQAFPMTRGGQTSVMKAPKPLTPEQLKELGIEIKKRKNMSEHFELATDSFQGPLEALLDLIEERKMPISDVSLSNVCDSYLSYVEKLPELPLGQTAQFILVASTLLLIKSRSLLPTLELSEDERESVEELERRLKMYALFRKAAKGLRKEWGRAPLFMAKRAPERPAVFSPAESSSATILTAARKLLNTLPKPEALIQAAVAPILALEDVISNLKDRLTRAFRAKFSELTQGADKESRIVHFLAMLELVRHGGASVTQEKLFSDITIELEGVAGTPKYGV